MGIHNKQRVIRFDLKIGSWKPMRGIRLVSKYGKASRYVVSDAMDLCSNVNHA